MMGWGDVWLLAGIGAWLGWQALLPVVLLSAIQGSAVGAVLLAVGRAPSDNARAKDDRAPASNWYAGRAPPEQPEHAADEEDWIPPPHAVPFGPFLALAALEVLLVGDALWTWYFGAMQRMFG